MATNMAITPYGYGTQPGQTNLGYYAQDTGVGAFAAADQSQMGPQQYAQPYGYSNQYMGQQTPGIGGQASVMPYAQQAAGYAQQANPWLGGTSQRAQQTGRNPYAGSNPYLQQNIDAALGDVTKNFNNVQRPAMDAAMRASGSFGNSALLEQQGNAYGDLAKQLGQISSGMRMQDYGMQQQLGESDLNRQQQVNLTNAGLSSGDLSRNMAGFYQGQGLGLQGLSGLLGAAQFDTGMSQRGNEFNANLYAGDLNRNSQLAGQQGMFNAGAQNQAGMFNAGQSNQMNMFGTGQRNAINQYNAGAANNLLENRRNRDQQQGQFDANLDYNIDNTNWNRERTGTQDQLAMLGQMLGWSQGGINNATTQQNMPLWYMQQFGNMANQFGQNGGTSMNNQQYQGNPWLGALGGWLSGGNWFGG